MLQAIVGTVSGHQLVSEVLLILPTISHDLLTNGLTVQFNR